MPSRLGITALPARWPALAAAYAALLAAPAMAQGTLSGTGASAATPSAAWVEQVTPLATEATRAAFAGRPGLRVEVVPGTLDPRLNLAPCNKVQPYLPAGHRAWGRTRIGLRCLEGPVAWNVSMPLTVKVYAPGLVARMPLSAGTTVLAEHLQEAEVEWTASDSNPFTDVQALAGRTLARPLAPGQAVREADMRRRQWFAAGDPVRLRVSGSGFQITGEGTALNPGLEGQMVRVRTEGGRTVTGRATADRLVEVEL
jgi:flagella basal body P-ring formation protein FlgA